MAIFYLSDLQKRLWKEAVTATPYTVDELAAFTMPAADSHVGTPAWGQDAEVVMDAIQGLCEYGYFTPAVVAYGDELLLEDWTFTKVDSPPASPTMPATVAWVIPWTIQGTKKVGIAP